ncbi:DUF4191 domain-containing protein [Actinotignum urinale]|uniref:DUF4191 domain-containing protein n=1 Tax=Actinotignum urinale TaxID=190146 RepID=A0AAW9HY95_9ACTO|nr:DUF4191 domain-containing protein [Actinotignum urinale]MDY5132199.1 DUF4191 domain-containing protein [Actinotignum urinale]MDY5151968.1 DUF4191 domain-containing protein [Actinotignum urinale]MDY5155425.1 DUF4191 domain-containing protein [Actinotignum urinale]MDY5160873.1 DUF4191 domain-containing protein [Actinotignum urinale]WIK59115.1 DUF4191 domain-containing protein [Actinotignum urinale]
MAKDKKAKKSKKPGMFKTFRDAYKITKKTYPKIGWLMLGGAILVLAIALGIAAATQSWISWSIIGILLMVLTPLVILTRGVRKASYAQIEGMPGAVTAIIDSMRGSWVKQNEPVRINPRTQDFVFRIVGRPGVVLVTEGPINRVQKLVDDERRALRRISANAPIHVIYAGNDEGQVPLPKLEKAIKRLKNQISPGEVSALSQRLEALSKNALNIPKGIDPTNPRAGRRSMR